MDTRYMGYMYMCTCARCVASVECKHVQVHMCVTIVCIFAHLYCKWEGSNILISLPVCMYKYQYVWRFLCAIEGEQ